MPTPNQTAAHMYYGNPLCQRENPPERQRSSPAPAADSATLAPPIQRHTWEIFSRNWDVDVRHGTLYDFYNSITFTADGSGLVDVSYRVVHSNDGGRTWSAPVVIAPDTAAPDVDPNTGAPLRTGADLPSPAIDPVTGQLYLAYEGSDFAGGAYTRYNWSPRPTAGAPGAGPYVSTGNPHRLHSPRASR